MPMAGHDSVAMGQRKSTPEQLLAKIKRHPAIAWLVVAGIILIGLANVTDAVGKLWNAARSMLAMAQPPDPDSRVASGIATPANVVIETGQESLAGAVVAAVSVSDVIATGAYGAGVKTWDLRTGELRLSRDVGLLSVNALDFSPDGRVVAIGGGGPSPGSGRIVVRDSESLEVGRPLLDRHPSDIRYLRFSPDGTRIAAASLEVWQTSPERRREAQSVAVLVDVPSARTLWRYVHPEGDIASIAFSPDGHLVFIGFSESGCDRVLVLSVDSGTVARTFPCVGTEVSSLAVSPERPLLAVAGSNGIALYDFDGDKQREFAGQIRHVAVAFSPDGAQLATGGEAGEINVWETATGQLVYTLRGADRRVDTVTFTADGRFIVASSGGLVSVWSRR